MYGRINLNTIDTQPGADNAFAPPTGFSGDYKRFMIARVKGDPGVPQHVAFVALKLRDGETPSTFHGQYAEEAKAFATSVFKKLMTPVKGSRREKQSAESF